MIKLSFIVPFYNVEKYIGACLDSLYAQDIPEEEFEVICIDDCSPDNSINIVRKYQQKHKNLILIEHERNLCLGGGRNTGIDAARGKYLWFIDSDDMIEPNSLKQVVQICEDNDLDLLMFNYKRINGQNEFIVASKLVSDSEYVESGLSFVNRVFGKNFSYNLGYVWRQIYRVDYLKSNNLRFPLHSFWEDTVFMPKALLLASRVKSIDSALYHYRVNEESVSGVHKKQYRADLVYQFSFIAGKDLFNFANEFKLTDQIIGNQLYDKSIWYFNSFISSVLRADFKEKRKFFQMVNSNQNSINEIVPYMTKLNQVICKNPSLGLLLTSILTPPYRLKRYFQKNR